MAGTNKTTASAATTPARLRLGRTLLLGTFGSEDSPAALLRLPSGHTQRAVVGDDTPAGRVTAIAPGAVHVTNGHRAKVLTVPGT